MSSARKRMMDYLNSNLSPRQHQQIEQLESPGGFMGMGINKDIVQENAKRAERNARRTPQNQKVEQRNQRLDDGADNVQKFLADRRIDAEQAAPYLLGAGLAAGAAGVTGSGLQAYNDQQSDFLPTGPVSVAGRMVSNLGGAASVGADPLSEARNKVAQARKIVGTEAMLEALTDDEIQQLRGEQEMAMTPIEYDQMSGVQQMIDQRAEQLRGTPIQKSDGSVAPMPFDTAQRIATEQVAMELRAGQVY